MTEPPTATSPGDAGGDNRARPSAERLAAIVGQFRARRIVTIGDLVADQFLYGEIARVSREAPVFILHHERTDTLPGGAANCAANLAALGARQTSLIGCVGDDHAGAALLAQLRLGGVDCAGVLTLAGAKTTTKVRVLAGQTHSTRQQVIRIDYEEERSPEPDTIDELLRRLDRALAAADAVIVSDYNYGVADSRVIDALRTARIERRIPVTVDSRFRLREFGGLTTATPNEDEVEQICGARLDDREKLEGAARALRDQLRCEALLVTRGPQGMLLQTEDEPARHIAAVGAREPVDVTGAGDTVIATYTLALASGASFAEAAHLANFAGGLAVMKRGTASVSGEELLSSIARHAG